jgi:hypothetical protein
MVVNPAGVALPRSARKGEIGRVAGGTSPPGRTLGETEQAAERFVATCEWVARIT